MGPSPFVRYNHLSGRPYDDMSSSVDSQFTDDEEDEELTVLDACIDCDDEALYDILRDGVTWAQVNEKDKSGRVRFSSLINELISNAPVNHRTARHR